MAICKRKLSADEMTEERTLYLEIPELSNGKDDCPVVVLRRPNAERITNYVRLLQTEGANGQNEMSKDDATYALVSECIWDEDNNKPLLSTAQVKSLDSCIYSRVAGVVSGFINTGENVLHPLVSPLSAPSTTLPGTLESSMLNSGNETQTGFS